jgi:hypothetical protein
MRYARNLTLFAMLALTIVATVSTAGAQTTVGTITQLQGVANIQRGALNIAAALNVPILLHDRITTQSGASLTIGLVDNSSLQLGSAATLSIDESVLVNGVGAPSKVGLLGGKLHTLIVGAMRGSTTTFEVHTPNAIGAVRGTEWTTDYEEGTPRDKDKYKDCTQFTDIDVQDGTVNVTNPLNPGAGAVDVHAGHHTTVACGAIFLDGAEGAAAGAGIGVGLATAIGVGIVAGGVIGGYAAAGGFDSNGGGGGPPITPSK